MTLNRLTCVIIAIALLLSANAGAHPFALTTSRTTQCESTPLDVDWQDRFSSSGGFTENLGQFRDPRVLFYASGSYGSIAFQENSVLLNIEQPASREPTRTDEDSNWDEEARFLRLRSSQGQVAYGSTVRLSFSGGDEVTPEGRARLNEFSNYFRGDDPTRWSTRVPSYSEVVYEDLYQGIDLVYREEGRGIKYEFIIHPGADPSKIITRVEGHDSLRVADGSLVISTKAGEITDSGLDVFYLDSPQEKVDCAFEVYDPDTYGFRLSYYNRSRTLVIDPLVYATYFGGSDSERAIVIVDSKGDPYLMGGTQSDDFPTTPGSYQLDHNGGQFECFVSKFSSDGSSLVFSTFIGGSDWDSPGWALIDQSGNIYMSGSTMSSDFPTTSGAYQEKFGGGPNWSDGDCFLLKLNATGDRLIYSTYIGSDDDDDQGGAISLTPDGSVIFNGMTRSSNFNITQGAFQTVHNGRREAFVCKLNPQGTDLVFSTFLGGSDDDDIAGIAVDTNGSIYVCGRTGSGDFPTTTGAYQTTLNGRDNAFITKLSSDGSSLIYSTYLGGDEATRANGILVDGSDNAHVTGYTASSVFPTTPGAYKRNHNDDETDIFITRLSADGKSLVSSTLLGGERGESGSGILLDEEGNVCLCGSTRSTHFPTTKEAPQKRLNGGEEAIVCKLSADYSELLYSTFLGGQSFDNAYRIAFDSRGMIWVGGYTHSTDFPTTNDAYRTHLNGQENDAFLCKVNMDTKTPAADAGPDVAIDQHQNVTFNGTNSTDNIGIVNWTWSFTYDGKPTTLHNSTVNFTFHDAGLFHVALTVRDEGNNTGSDIMNVSVRDIMLPIADANIDRVILQHDTIKFDGRGSSDNLGVSNWTWNFTYEGEDIFLYGPTPSFTFDEAGEYLVTLMVRDAAGYNATDGMMVRVVDITAPIANAGDDIVVGQHATAQFNGTLSSDNVGIVNWTWTFIHGAEPVTLYGSSPPFTFDLAGIYLVSLMVKDQEGYTTFDSVTVIVTDTTDPIAYAGIDKTINQGHSITFDGRGSSDNVGVARWTWLFEYDIGPINLSGSSPKFTFELAGEYVVTLTVTDPKGNQGTDVVVITVRDITPPVADAGPDVTVDQHETVTFDGFDSWDNVGVTGWAWSFLHNDVPITSEEERWEWTFADAGEYLVTLRVLDGAEYHNEDTMVVTVRDITSPIASTGPDRKVDQGTTVSLDGSSSTDNVGVVQWTWTFVYKMGPESVYGQYATFKFDIPGTYTILLTVEDAVGLTHEDVFELRVMDTVDPVLPGLDDIDTRSGERVIFDGTGATDNTGVVSWEWSYEEGGETVTLEGMHVEHAFENAGEYRVTLTVRDADGNQATETFTVSVSGGFWMWSVVAVVVIVVAVALLLWRMRKEE